MSLGRQILTLFFAVAPILICSPVHATGSTHVTAPIGSAETLVARASEAPLVSETSVFSGNSARKEESAPERPAATKLADNSSQERLITSSPQPGEALSADGITYPLDTNSSIAPATVRSLSIENSSLEASPPLGISFSSNATASRAVERNISLFSERIKNSFAIWLERSGRYVDIMKDVLNERNVPEELVFLPFVESGFNVNAYSRARAVGPWQFIEGTAKRYGLTVDWWRDERKDPVKSTRAAANYLRDLYKMFGSWNLALAAYNAGEGRISRALRRSDADDYWDLLHTKQIHPETKEYVPRYIAAALIASEPEKFGFRDISYHDPMDYDEVTLHGPVDIDVIAQCAESDVATIRELNPELRRWSTPPNMSSYIVRIPADSRSIFVDNLERIAVKDRFSYDTYTVKKKENLKSIAKKLSVPPGTLAALNNMGGIETVSAGETIKVPPKDKFRADLDDRMSAKKAAQVAARNSGKGKLVDKKKPKSQVKKVKTKKV
ncbi:MAG: membrane-bound lytic murein transglycosylase D [Nitrospirae bacterium]|nr:MAG: membrane-bound lytic murein transglycosylase D [Nitrospirota bacterium]